MPVREQSHVSLRCPVCFTREIDVVLFHDGEQYYCVKCSYTGDESSTREKYKAIRSKFKWIGRRVKIDEKS